MHVVQGLLLLLLVSLGFLCLVWTYESDRQ